MYHNFFILSSVSGHLGCFHVLAIVNSAAMNIGVHISLRIVVVSGYIPSSGIVSHVVVLFLVFKGNFIVFSLVAVSTYIPINCARGFPFLHILSSIYCLQIF